MVIDVFTIIGLCLLKEYKDIIRSDNSNNHVTNSNRNNSKSSNYGSTTKYDSHRTHDGSSINNIDNSRSSVNSKYINISNSNSKSTNNNNQYTHYQQIKQMAIIFFSPDKIVGLNDNSVGFKDSITSFIEVYNNTRFPTYR